MAPERFHHYYCVAIDAAAAGTRTLVAAPGAGLQIWVFGLMANLAAAATVDFINSTPTDMSGTMPYGANDGPKFPMSANPHAPWFKCATNTALQVTLTGAGGDLDGMLVYAIVAPPVA